MSTEFIKIIMPKNISIDDEVKLTIEDKLVKLAGEKTRKNNLLPSTLDCLHVKGTPTRKGDDFTDLL